MDIIKHKYFKFQFFSWAKPYKTTLSYNIMAEKDSEINKLIEYLSPNEIKIIPHLKEGSLAGVYKKTGLDKTAIVRSLEFLSNKRIISLTINQFKTEVFKWQK